MKTGKLSKRLLIHILIFSSFITLFITSIQIFLEYKRDMSRIELQINQIEQSFLKSLAKNIWYLNEPQIQLQLEGILALPDIVYIEIELESGSRNFIGDYDKTKTYIYRILPISYTVSESNSGYLGNLHVRANVETVYKRILERIVIVLSSQLFKTFFVSLFILFIFHLIITRHLTRLSSYAQSIDLNHLDQPLTLKKDSQKTNPDELDDVVRTINDMRIRINNDITEKKILIDQLTEAKSILEIKVRDRTAELENANSNLTREIDRRKLNESRIVNINSLVITLLGSDTFINKLNHITKEVVRIFNADFCRIWIIRNGDLCDSGCPHAGITEGPHVCKSRNKCLHLLASSGRYTHTDSGLHGRVPFACYKIGKIAAGNIDRYLINDVQHDPQIHNHDWAKNHNLVSFAGYRLISQSGDPIGVLALFSKNRISSEEDNQLFSIANSTAQVVQAHMIENQRESLIKELKDAIEHIKTLSGLLPICASCKKIRDDNGYWNQIETYIQDRSTAEFSHSICPDCSDRLYGNEEWYLKMKVDNKNTDL